MNEVPPIALGASVAVVDDDEDMVSMVGDFLESRGYDVAKYTTAEQFLANPLAPDVVLTDIRMDAMNGIELCRRIKAQSPNTLVVVMTGFGSMDAAVAAMRAGAYDFLTKPMDLNSMAIAVDRAAQHAQLRSEVQELRKRVSAFGRDSALIGDSKTMLRLHDLIDRIAETPTSVLITGESGTGKELVASVLHKRSGRKGAFIPVNCAAIPENLLESELFGHEKGSFTGANRNKKGLFEQADGGTIFLDEIGEMPIEMQVKLLRVLQERIVRPVGSERSVAVNVRVVSATNRDLEEEVELKRFREDLYYRLNVVRLRVPPLRERGADVLLLAQTFADIYAKRLGRDVTGFTPAAAKKLLAYQWPGNVRELENCVERGVALSRHAELIIDDLPDAVRDYTSDQFIIDGTDTGAFPTIAEIERRYAFRVLDIVAGNKSQAAEILGFDRRTLYRKLERWEEERDEENAAGHSPSAD